MDISNSEFLMYQSETGLKCFITLVLKGEIRFTQFTCFAEAYTAFKYCRISCHTTATSDQLYLISYFNQFYGLK